jgi:hypothetical protein
MQAKILRISIIAELKKGYLRYLAGSNRRNTLVFHRKYDELRRFAVARAAADDVDVVWAFIESFASINRDGLQA